MWISLLMLLLLLVTPISCRAEIRQEQGTRFRILLRIWGIPLRFDHSQAPMRPKPPSASSFKRQGAAARLPKLKRPVRLLMRKPRWSSCSSTSPSPCAIRRRRR